MIPASTSTYSSTSEHLSVLSSRLILPSHRNLLQIPQVGGFQPATDNVPTSPVFRINGTVGNNESLAALANSPFFRTQLRLFSAATFGSQERTLQAYPFDKSVRSASLVPP